MNRMIKLLAATVVVAGAVAAATALGPAAPTTAPQTALATTSTPSTVTPATVVAVLGLGSGRAVTVRDLDLPALRAKRVATSTAPFAVAMLADDATNPGKHVWVNAWIAPRNIEAAWDASKNALPEVLNAPVVP